MKIKLELTNTKCWALMHAVAKVKADESFGFKGTRDLLATVLDKLIYEQQRALAAASRARKKKATLRGLEHD
jgi:hypothetical protein